MVRRYGLAFVTAALLVLGAPSGASRVRAQEDPGESMSIELKDGKVRVKITTRDGRKLDKTLEADDFFRRIFPEEGGDEVEAVLRDLEKTMKALPEKIEGALDPEKARERAREIEGDVRRSLENLMERLDPGGRKRDEVKVHVGDKEMLVPARRGKARLY
jgi:hypothetical protein